MLKSKALFERNTHATNFNFNQNTNLSNFYIIKLKKVSCILHGDDLSKFKIVRNIVF
jgi:hypothetical protein